MTGPASHFAGGDALSVEPEGSVPAMAETSESPPAARRYPAAAAAAARAPGPRLVGRSSRRRSGRDDDDARRRSPRPTKPNTAGSPRRPTGSAMPTTTSPFVLLLLPSAVLVAAVGLL